MGRSQYVHATESTTTPFAVEDPHLMFVVAGAGNCSRGQRLLNVGDILESERHVEGS
jgi:hypothetical protein